MDERALRTRVRVSTAPALFADTGCAPGRSQTSVAVLIRGANDGGRAAQQPPGSFYATELSSGALRSSGMMTVTRQVRAPPGLSWDFLNQDV